MNPSLLKMTFSLVFAIATGIGLVTDKYMLEATNFVEHYAVEMKPNEQQKEFIKSSMYAGAILGMTTFGPMSDYIGRRICLILCSVITLAGSLLSMLAPTAEVLVLARILTGIGMGGEYPLASTHSAESATDADDGARNVALLYLFGSGGGPALCDLVTYLLDVGGVPPKYIWRCIFLGGSVLAFLGLVLRIKTTKNARKLTQVKRAAGTRRNFFKHYWRPLLGTAFIWMLFDVVEYGLKQNDAAIFAADTAGPYRNSVLTVFFTRLLVIPSLALAPWLLTRLTTKSVQIIGFAGCLLVNLVLACGYSSLKPQVFLFDALYIFQLSFQSLPGVTTMAIPAEIYPSAVKGTGSALSAASGKIGAVLGSYFFTLMKEKGMIQDIFTVVTCTSATALILTFFLTPHYNGATLSAAERLVAEGNTKESVAILYSGPQSENEEKNNENHNCESSFDGTTTGSSDESKL